MSISEEIGQRLSSHLSQSFQSLLDEKVANVDGIIDVVSWMQEEGTEMESETHTNKSLLEINRDRILSKISNKMTEQLLQYVPQFMGNLIVENIEVKTKGRTKSTKFDVAFVLDSFKPYVEIVKKINEVEVIKIKTVFQIDSDIKMLGVEFSVTENKKKIFLGKIIVHISITLIASAGILSTERVLREDTFEVDLSGIDMIFHHRDI